MKMYKIVFIDDEFLILEGLKKIIDWEEYNIKVSGCAEDAVEGIKLVKDTNPDIVISDIRMYEKNGLDMIEELVRGGYKGYIIILSGYQEFEYAKRAIENKVFKYLLKPLDVNELIQTITQITNELNCTTNNLAENGTIHDVIAYIDAHFFEDITLTDLSEKFHFDITYLSKLLKRNLGKNFIDYVTGLRINSAKNYVLKTDLSFDEISRRVGYNNVRQFREMFKKIVGTTPSEYKRINKNL